MSDKPGNSQKASPVDKLSDSENPFYTDAAADSSEHSDDEIIAQIAKELDGEVEDTIDEHVHVDEFEIPG